jgi:glutamate racemase
MDRRPIGIFDSGIGGLTVLKEIKKILPREDVVYFGDTARVPYGNKSKDTVIRFSIQNADFLVGLNVKMIVVACNTSSSYSLSTLKRRYDIPVVGVIRPGAEEAASITKNMKIGVIGTKATVASGVYEKELKRINPKTDVTSTSCPLFVPLVEEGWLKGNIAAAITNQYLNYLKKKKIDTIVLGCTHYPLLRSVIRDVLGEDIAIIDSATQVAKTVKRIICKKRLYNEKENKGRYRFYVSDEPKLFRKVGTRFLNGEITNIKNVEMGT